MYKIVESADPGSGDTKYLVVNKYSGKIEYVADTIDDAKSYVLSR